MYHKIQAPVDVVFATSEGVLQTLEGPVSHCRGDALLSGVAGERWPIKRADFDASYEAIAPTLPGNDSRYRKRHQRVMAEKLAAPTSVRMTETDCLHSQAGDWLLTDQHGRQWIVADAIFVRSYIKDDLP